MSGRAPTRVRPAPPPTPDKRISWKQGRCSEIHIVEHSPTARGWASAAIAGERATESARQIGEVVISRTEADRTRTGA